jgi:hypothetical protein
MIARILSNLERQLRAVELLEILQKEEFSYLAARDPSGVATVEFSLQELLRQLAAERRSLHRIYAELKPGASRLSEVINGFDPSSRERAESLYKTIDVVEKRCATQASRNYAMALGLYDVAKNSMNHLQKLLIPKKGVYGATGRVASATPGPGLINGRL